MNGRNEDSRWNKRKKYKSKKVKLQSVDRFGSILITFVVVFMQIKGLPIRDNEPKRAFGRDNKIVFFQAYSYLKKTN